MPDIVGDTPQRDVVVFPFGMELKWTFSPFRVLVLTTDDVMSYDLYSLLGRGSTRMNISVLLYGVSRSLPPGLHRG